MGISTLMHACAYLSLIIIKVNTQKQVNDSCVLIDGKAGKCLRIENCSTAMELVTSRKGRPEHCGFEGKYPIVCCSLKVGLQNRPIGEISKQKCFEAYSALPELTTEAPVTYSNAPIPDNWTVEELIKMLEEEEKAAELAGKSLPKVQKQAVGGVDAKPAEFPHMAVLGYGTSEELTWGCGGSLISERHVLTAAHCIHTNLGRVKYVRVGDLNLNLTTDKARPQNFNVSRTIVHHAYRAPSVYHDIAIIELSANVEIDDFTRPGCLNTERDISDSSLSATGWGVTSYLGSPADHLQKVSLRSFTEEECQMVYASTSKRRLKNGIDFNSQVCAGDYSQDTCQGDSGGPLQIKNVEFTRGHKVVGVTSFGKACGIGVGPAVYTRVSHYIEWIELIVWPQ